jgi:hypothetical protein
MSVIWKLTPPSNSVTLKTGAACSSEMSLSTHNFTQDQNEECYPVGSEIGSLNSIKRFVFIMENGCLLRGRN